MAPASRGFHPEFRFAPPNDGAVRVCGGLTCRIAGSERVAGELRAEGREVEAHECMFLCAAAPLTADGSASIEIELEAGEHYLCLQIGDGEHRTLDEPGLSQYIMVHAEEEEAAE